MECIIHPKLPFTTMPVRARAALTSKRPLFCLVPFLYPTFFPYAG